MGWRTTRLREAAGSNAGQRRAAPQAPAIQILCRGFFTDINLLRVGTAGTYESTVGQMSSKALMS